MCIALIYASRLLYIFAIGEDGRAKCRHEPVLNQIVILGGRIMKLRNKLIASALAVTAALTISTAFAADGGVVGSSDLQNIDKWYGRAGGLTGSDSVSGLTARSKPLGVSWDQDVASRTNMSVNRDTSDAKVGVTYDADVAARTNMGRGTPEPATKAAGVEGAKAN